MLILLLSCFESHAGYCFWTIDPFSASEAVNPWVAAVIINEAENENRKKKKCLNLRRKEKKEIIKRVSMW